MATHVRVLSATHFWRRNSSSCSVISLTQQAGVRHKQGLAPWKEFTTLTCMLPTTASTGCVCPTGGCTLQGRSKDPDAGLQ
jgi:hypothetical protein